MKKAFFSTPLLVFAWLFLLANSTHATVTVYQHCNYGGYSVVLDEGEYDLIDLVNLGVMNDDVSSVRITDDSSIVLYEHGEFAGRSLTVDESISCLVNHDFNDLLSSASISSYEVANRSSGELECDYTNNIIWEGANDLFGAVPALGDAAKFMTALSKIGNNVACNGKGITKNRVEQIAYDVVHSVLESSAQSTMDSISSDLDDYKDDGVLPPPGTLVSYYVAILGIESDVNELDFYALDFSVALASIKIGLLNGEIAQRLVSDSDEAGARIGIRKSQSQNSLAYFESKEYKLNQYLGKAVAGVEVFPEPYCSDSPCYEEYRGYVEYPVYDYATKKYVHEHGQGKRVYTSWRICEGINWRLWCTEHAKAEKDAKNLLISHNASIRNTILNSQYRSIKHELQKYAYGRDDLEVSLSGQLDWEILDLPDNGPMHTADFDGDGLNDIFSASAGAWYIAYGGSSTWQKVNESGIGVNDLGFGDFNGDGATDILANWGDGKWHVSWAATGSWQELNTSNIRPKDLGFGDFDGDGTTDILAAWGDGKWHIRWAGIGAWQHHNNSDIRINDLGFGDFDGDGRTDVFAAWGNNRWNVRWGGQGDWKVINTSGLRVKDLAFHDFNGDGRTDVFSTFLGYNWVVSWGGSASFQTLRNESLGLRHLAFGDFNADGITDVLRDEPVVIPPPPTCQAMTRRTESNHTWAEFRLPQSSPGTVIQFENGQYPRYVFPACHRVWWESLKFTCGTDGNWVQTGSMGADGWCHGSFVDEPYLFTGEK